jgi:putative thioredoxin
MNAEQSSDSIISTSEGSFDDDVFVRSREVLVVVDFWAPWCGPCRALGPVLERLAESYQGKFTLVKANTDETPTAASRFNVAGIPAVFAVSDGQIVDFFSGALPEPHVRVWLDGVLNFDQRRAVRRLEQTSPSCAEASYR